MEWVRAMIHPWYSYESWFIAHHRALYGQEKDKDRSLKFLQEARLQWLDWMIAECEKEEAKV